MGTLAGLVNDWFSARFAGVVKTLACSFLLMSLGAVAQSSSSGLIDVVARVKPAIVIVGTFKATNSPRFALRGTGFVVGDGNFAVTNAHVIPEGLEKDPESKIVIQVRTPQNELQARLVTVLEIDKPRDLALLQFDGPPVPKLSIRDSDAVREGQSIAFMGFPIGGALGFSPVTHRGIISSITAIALPSSNSTQLNARNVASLRSGEGLRALSPAGETSQGRTAADAVRGGRDDALPVILFGNSRGTMATGWAMTKNFDRDCTLDLPEINCGPPLGDRTIKAAILFAEFTSGQGYVMDRPSAEDEERGLGRDRPLFIGGNEVENNLIFFPSSAILAGMDKWPAAFFARGLYDYAASLQGTMDSYSRVKGPKELVVVRGPHPFESWPPPERQRSQKCLPLPHAILHCI